MHIVVAFSHFQLQSFFAIQAVIVSVPQYALHAVSTHPLQSWPGFHESGPIPHAIEPRAADAFVLLLSVKVLRLPPP